ncbi:hypothetical protein [Nocardiopsis sp. ATB16-24]|uniref:hypothetical protein n=1 Tax=Nocardiopsis sp. ATB16-24 TaxID=3019555 RepID=UPI0025549410|nr:hypothetical protein [Nocardiopsis sp. ATB16-24]
MVDTTDRPDDELPEQNDEHKGDEKTHVRFTDVEGGAINVGNASGNVTFFVGSPKQEPVTARPQVAPGRSENLGSQREDIYLRVLNQKSRHVEVNFWVSILFIVIGVAIVAAGLIVALVRAEAMPLLVSLFGAPFAVIGWWLKGHVRQTDAALEARIDRIEQQIDEDARWKKVTTFIDTVEDPGLRDRFRADAARWMLTSEGPAQDDRPLPESGEEGRGRIGPGGSPS